MNTMANVKVHLRTRRGNVNIVKCQQCSNIFSPKTARPIKAKFHVEPPWDGGTKVYINSPGNMTKMAPIPMYDKTFKNLLLQTRKSYDLETWHAASGTGAIESLYKW